MMRAIRVFTLLVLAMTAMNAVAEAGRTSLDAALASIDPDVKRWATVVIVTDGPDGRLVFDTHHAGEGNTDGMSVDFWPASCVKLYTVIAGFELLNELGMPDDSVLAFERKTAEGRWVRNGARTLPETSHTIFHESSNDDYTLELRFVGLDRLNRDFFTPAKGFRRTALMRGYVHGPPYNYDRAQPQRIVVTSPDGGKRAVVEHTWSGASYAERHGARVIDAATGNCSPTADMAECLRRVIFHESIPAEERYDLTAAQLELIREGRDGFTGLRNTRYAFGWDDAVQWVFPDAAYYHKPGNISNFYLDLAYVRDDASRTRFVMAIAAGTDNAEPVKRLSRRIAEWVRDGR